MADLGELVVRIKADAAQLESELKRVTGVTQQSADKMGSALSGLQSQFAELIPAITVAAVVEFGRRSIEAAGHMQDLGDRIGFAASTLSALEAPLKTNGSNLDEFSASVNRMNNMIGEAAKGTNQEAVKAFDALGLSIRKLKEMSPEEQFYAVTQAIMQLDSQAKITNAGMNIFGRSFSAMLPTLKEHNGNMREAVESAKKLGDAISDEKIKRIDEFGDAMSRAALKTRDSFLELLGTILQVMDAIPNPIALGEQVGTAAREAMGLGPKAAGEALNVSGDRPSLSDEDVAKMFRDKLAPNRASGSNSDLLQMNAAQEMLKKLQQESSRSMLAPADRAGQQAADEMRLLALKDKTVHVNQQMIDQAYALAKANYEAANPDPITEYITKLQQENEVLGTQKSQQAGLKAYYDLLNATKKEHIAISDEEKQKVIELADANEKLKEKMQEAERYGKELHDGLSKGLADIALSADKASVSIANFAQQLANTILQKKITGPLTDSLVGTDGMSGLLGGLFGGSEGSRPDSNFVGPMGSSGGIGSFFSGLGFADGGRPPVGKASMVGENGPELFIPDSAGTVIPNGGMGGGVSVTNVFHISPGIQGTVQAELNRAIPGIINASTNSVMSAFEKGGRASQIVGKRN